jgi:cytoskeleton protein RodZ
MSEEKHANPSPEDPGLPIAPSPVDPALSVEAEIGDCLGSARREKGLSIAEVAHSLRLGERQVEAIEVGAFELLPGKTFVRGFIRNYARAMGIDHRPLLARLDEAGTLTAPGLDLPESTHAVMPSPAGSGSRRWPLFAALLLVLAAAVVWLALPDGFLAHKLERPAQPGPASAQPEPGQAQPQEKPGNEADEAGHPATEQEAAEANSPAPEEGKAPGSASEAEKTEAASNANAAAQHAPGEKHLHFAFADNAWVEVRDRSGQILLSKEFPAHSVRDVYGLPPLAVSVGNAAKVALSFEGQPVKLSPAQPSGVARVRLE